MKKIKTFLTVLLPFCTSFATVTAFADAISPPYAATASILLSFIVIGIAALILIVIALVLFFLIRYFVRKEKTKKESNNQ